MSDLAATLLAASPNPAQLVAAFLAGAALGAVHYATLAWNVRLLTGGGSAVVAILLQLARLAVIGIALFALVKVGAAPLLVAVLGLTAARAVAVRLFGRRA